MCDGDKTRETHSRGSAREAANCVQNPGRCGGEGRRMWGDRHVIPVDQEREQTTGVVAELQKQLTLVEVMGTNLALNG